MNLNRVIIGGNLTRDPEIRFMANENAVGNFGLAINRKFKDREGNAKDEVVFVDVECWGRTAELVGQFLTKGKGALIEGRLKLDVWEDKDGQKRQRLKVVADMVHFTGAGTGEGRAASGGPNGREETQPPAGAAPAAAGTTRPSNTPRPRPAGTPVGTAADDEPPF